MPNTQERNLPSKSLADMHPISQVSVGQVLGLVEAIDEVGGSADAATISQEVEMDIDRLGPVIDAAELLGFVRVTEGDLAITDLSHQVLGANVRERKRIIRGILTDAPIFREILDMAGKAGRPLTRVEIVDAIASVIGSHNADDFFRALVYWGRYTELMHYDSESEELSVRTPSP